MPLCGSSTCGCAIVSVPSTATTLGGFLPTIDVAGNGTAATPWNLTLDDNWAGEVADLLTPTAWTAVSFANSWVNYGAGVQEVEYRMILGDWVQIRGSMKDGTLGSAAFTLPVGFRPPAEQDYPLLDQYVGVNYAANIWIEADGTCTPFAQPSHNTKLTFAVQFSTSS